MEVAPFFVDFPHFLSIFTIFYWFSRFTHFCHDLHFVAIYAKIAISATSHVFCMYDPMTLDLTEMAGPCKYCVQNDVRGTRLLFQNVRGMIYAWKQGNERYPGMPANKDGGKNADKNKNNKHQTNRQTSKSSSLPSSLRILKRLSK